MLRKIVEARGVVALASAGGIGAWGLHAYPLARDDVFLGLIGEQAPGVLAVLAYGYATLWFTTPHIGTSLVMSLVATSYRDAERGDGPPLIHSLSNSRRRCSCRETYHHTIPDDAVPTG